MSGSPEISANHATITVTTSSAEALAANANRSYVFFQNVSDVDMYLKFGGDAVVDEGIKLLAGTIGSSYTISSRDGNLHTGAVNVIRAAAAGTKLLHVTEGS